MIGYERNAVYMFSVIVIVEYLTVSSIVPRRIKFATSLCRGLGIWAGAHMSVWQSVMQGIAQPPRNVKKR